MHSRLTRRARRPRNDEGAVAILMALCMGILLIVAALVLDFGLVRVDRQVDKSAADAATIAGLHALNTGGGKAHPYTGVCTAVRYLQRNGTRFGGVTDTAGQWANGTGGGTGNGCTDATLRSKVCIPGNQASWARFTWSGTWQGQPLSVIVQSGYTVPGAGSTWAEDALPAAIADNDDQAQGCDQLAIIVSQTRQPGFGSLATDSDLKTSIRSVGRVKLGPGGYAPAMILLKQTGCSVLTAGSSAGGSQIKVAGAYAPSNGLSQPGTIHSDSDGSGCGSNENIYTGQANGGIVAYAAPTASGLADPTKPGQITSEAAQLGLSGSSLSDSGSNVCGSNGIYPSGTCPGQTVSARDRVHRQPIDDRYLTSVQAMRDTANSVFSAAPSWSAKINNCGPTQATVNSLNLTSSSQLYINCNANNGFNPSTALTIDAGTIVFSGKVNPGNTLKLPNAHHVYVVGDSGDAFSLGNGGTFSMHSGPSDGNLVSGLCSDSPTLVPNKAVLVVKNGTIKQTGGSLQMCYTTVLMMGGQTNACLPSSPSTAPPNPTTPCGGSSGTGQFTQTGGDVDWTAPNRYDATMLSDGSADPTKQGEWADANGPEDLGLWSESGGTSSNPKYQMTGGGAVHLRGVLMAPNAQPFVLSGQFDQTLINAQYVVSSISLSSNNTNIKMQVDPNAAVTLPKLMLVGLVR